MPIIKSAIKRVRVTERKRKVNLVKIRRYKELIKRFETLLTEGNVAEAQKLFPQVQKAIDLAAKKNLLHKNTAARKKSRLAKLLADPSRLAHKKLEKSAKKAPKKATEEKKAAPSPKKSTEKVETDKKETEENKAA